MKLELQYDYYTTRVYMMGPSDIGPFYYVAFEDCNNYYPENRTYMLKNWFIQ